MARSHAAGGVRLRGQRHGHFAAIVEELAGACHGMARERRSSGGAACFEAPYRGPLFSRGSMVMIAEADAASFARSRPMISAESSGSILKSLVITT